MEPLLIVLIVVLVVVLTTAGFLVAGRSRGGVELEPPLVDASTAPTVETPVESAVEIELVPDDVAALDDVAVLEPTRPSFRDRLAKARGAFSGYLGSILSRTNIDAATWDELEEALIRADVGAVRADDILTGLRATVKSESITEPRALLDALKVDMIERLTVDSRELVHLEGQTAVWLVVGVNGVGKTTTIGKLGWHERELGHSTVMVAGDTFRAAAAEQLEMWAERSDAHFVRGAEGADPSSVIFDGIEAGVARKADVVLCDTAGRLHNKSNLMDELRKVRRVAGKAPGEVTEVLLVLDATTGQNGLEQARVFTEAVEVTGVVLTKLDGSAKGGIVLAIQAELEIPVKLVGLGESAQDLVVFDPEEFVDALFAEA